jgi:hypothetical protein
MAGWLAKSKRLIHSSMGIMNGDCVMNDDLEPGADDNTAEQSQGPTRREALGRFARYTAPVMLAMLLSERSANASAT